MGLFRRLFTNKKSIIIVSGLPRSGTSMMMKMLEAGGITPLTDNLRSADSDNPRGYYEYERVKKLDKGDTGWLEEAEGKAVKVISQLLKFLPDSHQYKVIFLRRNIDEILASQKRMLQNRGEDPDKVSDDELRKLFEKHLAHVLRLLEESQNMDVLQIHYRNVLEFPQPQAAKLNDFLGGELDTGAITAVIDPELYRNRKDLLP